MREAQDGWVLGVAAGTEMQNEERKRQKDRKEGEKGRWERKFKSRNSAGPKEGVHISPLSDTECDNEVLKGQ